jgi:hypothetical protein
VVDVRKGQAALTELFLELRDTTGRAAVIERPPLGCLEEIAADDALCALMVEVDRLEGVHRPILR